MGGVRHELPLGVDRHFEDAEHRVEARGQARQLVGPEDFDPTRQVAGGDDVLGCPGEPADGGHRGPGDQPAGPPGQSHPSQGEQDQRQPQAVQRPIDLIERPGELDGQTRADPGRQDAHVQSGDHRVLEERGLPSRSHRADPLGDGQHDLRSLRQRGAATRVHGLRVSTRATEREIREPDPEHARPHPVGHGLEAAPKGAVDLTSELAAHGQIGDP